MKLAVECTDGVMFIWTTTKSSYLDFAPGYLAADSWLGLVRMHLTARMYSFLSSFVRSPLHSIMSAKATIRNSNSTYYSFLIATVLALHSVLRVRPSAMDPFKTLKALASACFCMSSIATVCRLERKGTALTPEKKAKEAARALETPTMAATKLSFTCREAASPTLGRLEASIYPLGHEAAPNSTTTKSYTRICGTHCLF